MNMMEATDVPPQVITQPSSAYHANKRLWQGIPGIAATPGGRLWATWYTGGKGETIGNHVVLVTSHDMGTTWTEPVLVVQPDEATERAFDPVVWVDPTGRLWLFWSQSRGMWFDGRAGVWAIVCDDPESASPSWSSPVRIAHGIMMNKPTVLPNGEWALPTAVWDIPHRVKTIKLPHLSRYQYSGLTISSDQGTSFHWRGGADVPNRCFDEHMTVALNDGRLWMLVRTFEGPGQSFSSDMGVTWTPGEPSSLRGPNTRFFIARLPSGRLLLVYHNPPDGAVDGPRTHLTAFLSDDDGQTWPHRLLLDERFGVSYPDVAINNLNGRLLVIYDRNRGDGKKLEKDREILMADISEEDILAGHILPGQSRLQVLVNRATG